MLNWLGQCLYQSAYSKKERIGKNKLSAIRYPLSAKRGSILIIVLWALFFLSMLAVAVSAYIRPQLALAGKLKDRTKLYYLAKAGVKRAIWEIQNDETDLCDALKEPWSNNEDAFKEVELGEGSFSVQRIAYSGQGIEEIKYGLIDEERKININKASYTVLKNFFKIVGETTPQWAADIAASIIDWRDEDDEPLENGAESGYYLTLKPGYPCKNKSFEVLEEMLLVKGISGEAFSKVKDRATVFGAGLVNINTADELVLRSLGMDNSLAKKVIRFRDDSVFENVNTIAQFMNASENLSEDEIAQINEIIHNGLLCVCSDNFMGKSIGKVKGRENSFEIVFVFDRDKDIRYWREK